MDELLTINQETPTEDLGALLKSLIYEIIDGKPIYYRGFEEVLIGKKKLADIMGSSSLQSLIVSVLLKFLYRNLSDDSYQIFTNEFGLHLDKNVNLSCDIVIYDKSVAQEINYNEHYAAIPPRICLEVDTDADVKSFLSPLEYYFTKTQKLLDFGVEKVIWITSKNQKITVATRQDSWLTMDWQKEIQILENCGLSLGTLLEQTNFKME